MKMAEKYIKASECEKYFYEHLDDNGMIGAMNAIDEMPAADVQPICHGRWENIRNVKLIDAIKRCECNQCHNKIYGGLSYCGNCGARMDGDIE